MLWLRRGTILVTLFLLVSFIAWFAPRALNPSPPSPEKRARDSLWVNSSPYFWDRQICRWISICGLLHLRKDPAALPAPLSSKSDVEDDDVRMELRRRSDLEPPLSWEDIGDRSKAGGTGASPKRRRRVDDRRDARERRKQFKPVPDFVLRYAPLVHLYSGEQFWPSDIREHVQHMNVSVEGEFLNTTDRWTLDNLQKLNENDGVIVLHSADDVETRPQWLHSHFNRPNPFPDDGEEKPTGDEEKPDMRKETTSWFDVGRDDPLHRITAPRFGMHQQRPRSEMPRLSSRGHKPDASGYSRAPAVLILVDKGSGILDAFWFFFYSYNLGQTVLGIRFGNHIGDWEHSMIRFENGEPRGIFFSEHEGGQAYAWDAVGKRGERPVIYSAVGSHAMYPLPGDHPYVLPFRMLKDVTDKGPLWDPALNNYAYHYDYTREDPQDTWDPLDGEISQIPEPEDELADIHFAENVVERHNTRDTHSLVPAASNPNAPTSWFHFKGRWGDQVYSLADIRQWRLFGQYHYVTGPAGPKFKRLDRAKMCQSLKCRILYKVDPKRTWY
ncbi:vacuolar sorting-associated protein [Drechmeria coniospora]|uniref:Vacuolar sorting-associated protein n=1 Tax=Drechmeria coniospora TaxID=98403 RepID=A0A151GTS2_DRECN|nr:vacuolar sorting-associated protein [Drechmeria coniospora]KYK60471.1 vacuolar sorting-associated protein [Drechmeria coniospora]